MGSLYPNQNTLEDRFTKENILHPDCVHITDKANCFQQ